MDNTVNLTDPLMGLFELENIITIVADGWDEKIVQSQIQITQFLEESDDKNIVAITKDPTSAKKVNKVFDDPRVLVANTKDNLEPMKDLSSVYAIVVVDSGLFNDYTKYLIALQAKDNGCRLVFVA